VSPALVKYTVLEMWGWQCGDPRRGSAAVYRLHLSENYHEGSGAFSDGNNRSEIRNFQRNLQKDFITLIYGSNSLNYTYSTPAWP